jgi:hypothetical protein
MNIDTFFLILGFVVGWLIFHPPGPGGDDGYAGGH